MTKLLPAWLFVFGLCQNAYAQETIILTPKCPLDDGRTCIETSIRLPDNRLSGNILASAHPKFATTFDYGSVYFTAKSRQGKQLVKQSFEARPTPHPCGTDINVAFLGYDNLGGLIVLTQNGQEVVIQDPEVKFFNDEARKLFDRKTGRPIGGVMVPYDNTSLWAFTFTDKPAAYLWESERCLKMPLYKNERLKTVANTNCTNRQTTWPNQDDGTSAASESSLEIARKYMPEYSDYYGKNFLMKVRDINGTFLFFVDTVDPCT